MSGTLFNQPFFNSTNPHDSTHVFPSPMLPLLQSHSISFSSSPTISLHSFHHMLPIVIVNKYLFDLFYQLANSLRGGYWTPNVRNNVSEQLERHRKVRGQTKEKIVRAYLCRMAQEGGWDVDRKEELEELSKARGTIPGPSPGSNFWNASILWHSMRWQGSQGFLPLLLDPKSKSKGLINDLLIYYSWHQKWTNMFESRL